MLWACFVHWWRDVYFLDFAQPGTLKRKATEAAADSGATRTLAAFKKLLVNKYGSIANAWKSRQLLAKRSRRRWSCVLSHHTWLRVTQ